MNKNKVIEYVDFLHKPIVLMVIKLRNCISSLSYKIYNDQGFHIAGSFQNHVKFEKISNFQNHLVINLPSSSESVNYFIKLDDVKIHRPQPQPNIYNNNRYEMDMEMSMMNHGMNNQRPCQVDAPIFHFCTYVPEYPLEPQNKVNQETHVSIEIEDREPSDLSVGNCDNIVTDRTDIEDIADIEDIEEDAEELIFETEEDTVESDEVGSKN